MHTDAHAGRLTASLHARAFTVGEHVVFGAPRLYAPESSRHQRLLAHELVHVVQQRRTGPMIQRQTEGEPASSLIPNLTEAPLGTTSCEPGQSCAVPSPTSVAGGRRLTPREVTARRAQVQQSITRSRATYPIAAANFQHWLDGSGRTRILAGSIFQDRSSGLPRFLEHGLGSNRSHLDMFIRGVERRLDPADPESLLPAGTRRVMVYCNSTRALPSRGAVAADLAIALGGFTVKSWVTLSAHTVPSRLPFTTTHQVSVESWRVQICDRYDWRLGALAQIPRPITDAELRGLPLPPGAVEVTPLPGGLNILRIRDNWLRELEAAGGGLQFPVYSEVFSAPRSLVNRLERERF